MKRKFDEVKSVRQKIRSIRQISENKQYQTKIIQFEKSLSFGNRRLVMKTLSKHYHTANSFDKVTAKKNLQNQPNLREFKHSKIRDPNFGIELPLKYVQKLDFLRLPNLRLF